MRRYVLPIFLKLSLVFVFCTPGAAQYNFYKYSFGIGGGITLPFGDVRSVNYSLANQVSADYYFTPNINTGIEVQFGNMRGGDQDKNHFTNTFVLTAWNTRMQLGQFYGRFDRLSRLLWLMRGLYGGAGVGIIRNNVLAVKSGVGFTNINRGVIFPFTGGYNLYLQDMYERDRWELNFSMQFVVGLEDAMDGDLNPNSQFNDVYNYFSTGIRYKFGAVGLDKRKGRIK